MKPTEIKKLFKRFFEIIMPDLRNYYRIAHKAEIVRTYACSGQYWADVQPLLNDESADENREVVERVEIPVTIGGSGKGIVSPPLKGTKCVLAYFDGDPDYPWISNFRWSNGNAPTVAEEETIIQTQEGVSIKFGADKKITILTSGNVDVECVEAAINASGKTILSGSILELNGNSDFAVKFTKLNTGFEQLKTELNALITAYNTALYTIGGVGATGTTSTPAVPSTATIAASKADKVKI
ncbi:MAG: hypothetical protein GY760_21250 [Deltaproteobacteria bacterium]|nr:hypothetical protein [Deltaproteobacteria bacterium]